MKVRKEQMEAFSESRLKAFAQRMIVHLRDDFRKERSSNSIADRDIPDLVLQGVQDAEQYGVVNERDVKLYLECMVLFNPKFDRKLSWASEILKRKDVSGRDKMEMIHGHLVFGHLGGNKR